MTDANSKAVNELVDAGLDRREARWLVEEFETSNDPGVLQRATARRLAGEPLQYVLGHWPFRTLDLDVDERGLIPRPESEALVEVALDALERDEVASPLLLDLGCGSGAIGLALLDELQRRGVVATLIGVDESLDALALARQNAVKHRLERATFVHSSWFDGLDASLRERFDLITANPPYVSRDEFAVLDPVLRFEPRGAIVAPDTTDVKGFSDLSIIIAQAPSWLRLGGTLVCEHANTHREAVLTAAASAGLRNVLDHDDLAGQPRIMVAQR